MRKHSILHLKMHLVSHFKKGLEIAKKCAEKNAFDVAVDGPPTYN